MMEENIIKWMVAKNEPNWAILLFGIGCAIIAFAITSLL